MTTFLSHLWGKFSLISTIIISIIQFFYIIRKFNSIIKKPSIIINL